MDSNAVFVFGKGTVCGIPCFLTHRVDLESLFPDILSQLGENIIRASLRVVNNLVREECACFFNK